MFSQAMQFSGVVRPLRGAGGDAQGQRLGHVGEVLIEHRGKHQPGVANLLGDRRAVEAMIDAVAGNGDLLRLLAEDPDRVAALAAEQFDQRQLLIDEDDLEPRLPGQQPDVPSPGRPRAENHDLLCHILIPSGSHAPRGNPPVRTLRVLSPPSANAERRPHCVPTRSVGTRAPHSGSHAERGNEGASASGDASYSHIVTDDNRPRPAPRRPTRAC